MSFGSNTFGEAAFGDEGMSAIIGNGAITLEDATAVATGHPVGYGTAAPTLDSFTAEGYGGNSAAITLEDATVVATGHPVGSGTAATTLEDATAVATGHPVGYGSGVPTLQDAGGAASGSGIIAGTIGAPLDSVTVVATGHPVAQGSAATTLDAATAVLSGNPVVKGSVATTLSNMTSVGFGYPLYDLHLLSAALASPTSLVLTYDTEPQLSVQSARTSDWAIVSSTGAPIDILDVAVAGLTVTLTTTEHTDGASYTVIGSRNVYSVSGHRVLGPYNANYTGDGVVPTVTRVQCLDANTLRVFFSENMNDADLLDVDRYTIAGVSGDPLYVVPVALSVTKLTDNNVDVTTTELVRGQSYDLTVTVRDRGLNAVA